MSMPPASPGRPTHRLPWFRHGPRTPTRPRSVGVDQPIVRRPRRPDRPPVRPGGRLGRRYRCPGQTDGASRRQVPSPTIAASHAGRPARPSDKTPSHRDTGLLRPLLGRARGQGLFCNRHIACRGDEFGKLRVGHRVSLYRKGAHGHGMNRRFFGVEARRAHAERSAGQVNQLGQHDFSVCRPRRPASQQTAQSREKASARSDSTSSNGRPDTSTVTWVMVPPVNANGAS